MPRKVMKLAARLVDGFDATGRMLLRRPTGHILRGFLLDRTSSKGLFRIWRVVAPLYIPMRSVALNYSDYRRADFKEDQIQVIPAQEAAAAEYLAREIVPTYLPRVDAVQTPMDFLPVVDQLYERIRPTVYVNIQLERALTHFLCGDVGAATEQLEEIKARSGTDPLRQRHIDVAIQCLDMLRDPAGDLGAHLEAVEAQNLRTLFPADVIHRN